MERVGNAAIQEAARSFLDFSFSVAHIPMRLLICGCGRTPHVPVRTSPGGLGVPDDVSWDGMPKGTLAEREKERMEIAHLPYVVVARRSHPSNCDPRLEFRELLRDERILGPKVRGMSRIMLPT